MRQLVSSSFVASFLLNKLHGVICLAYCRRHFKAAYLTQFRPVLQLLVSREPQAPCQRTHSHCAKQACGYSLLSSCFGWSHVGCVIARWQSTSSSRELAYLQLGISDHLVMTQPICAHVCCCSVTTNILRNGQGLDAWRRSVHCHSLVGNQGYDLGQSSGPPLV